MSHRRVSGSWDWWATAVAMLGLAVFRLHAVSYYVDSAGGDDAGNGTNQAAPWKSLAKVNGTAFQPGDSILFKSGGRWTGQLNPKGSGTAGGPIVIDQYGSGAKPVIDAHGATGNGAVYFFNQEYWEINNLEILNDAATGADRRGVYLSASNFAGNVVNHLHVRNCDIHNIKGIVDQTSNAAKRTGGIIVEVIDDTPTPTRFNGILIENCTIRTVDNQGIALNNKVSVGDYPGTPAWEARKFTQVVIRGNRISDVAKNAMIIRLTDETGLIERNVCWDTAYRAYTGNTIFSRSCRGTVFQFNEGYLNRAGERNPAKAFDGSLYDADLQSPGCIFQYSYSHDNAHGLYWQCTDARDTNVIVRYNVSQNDKGIIFCMNYDCASTYVYNNVVFVGTNRSPRIVDERRSGAKTYWFYNNVVYNLSPTASYQWFNGVRTFDYNLFFGQHPAGEPADAHKLTSDPLMAAPGTGGFGLDSLAGYRLEGGSPCIDAGVTVPGAGSLDFWGNAVPINGATDRGAHEWTGTTIADAPPLLTQQPESQTVTLGNQVTFTVVATGTLPMSYQWRKSGTVIPGAINAIFTLFAVSQADAAGYDVVITNAFGAKTSSVAALTVESPVPPRSVPASSRATIRDGVNADTDLDEAMLGYVMVKYNTNGLAAKGYFGLDLAGQNADTHAPAQFQVVTAASSGAQHLQLWALNQAFVDMSDGLVWNTAQANHLGGNGLLTNGAITATPLAEVVLPGGAGTNRFTIPPPWGQFVFSNRLVLALTGVADPTNASAGLRIVVTNSTEQPLLNFSARLPSLPSPKLMNWEMLPSGEFSFSFLGLSGVGFVVLGTTNLLLPIRNWSELGTAEEVAPGEYHFNDSRPNADAQRFYAVRSS